jgi:hypothetical protein
VEDESGRGGDETSDYNVNITCSCNGPDNILVCDCDREYYPGGNDGKDFSGAEL